jgi:hypothetical protein
MDYLGFASENEYHEYYTLYALLERERNRSERASIRRRLKEIRATRHAPAPSGSEPA